MGMVMGWSLSVVVIGGILTWLVYSAVYGMTIDEDIAGSCAGVLIIILLIVWIWGTAHIAGLRDHRELFWVHQGTDQIYAIQDTTSIYGKFSGGRILARGIIGTKWQYVAYIADGNKLNLKQYNADASNLYEQGTEHKIEVYRRKAASYTFLIWTEPEAYTEEYYYDIFVPVGTVISDYNLDLQQ